MTAARAFGLWLAAFVLFIAAGALAQAPAPPPAAVFPSPADAAPAAPPANDGAVLPAAQPAGDAAAAPAGSPAGTPTVTQAPDAIGGPAIAPGQKSADMAPAVEEIEEVVEVQEVKDVGRAGPGPKNFFDLLGRLHPPIVHFPVAWLLLLALIDAATFLFARPWTTGGYYLGFLALLSFIPAAVTGFLRYNALGLAGDAHELAETHRNIVLTAFALLLVAVILRARKKNRLDGAARWVYLALVFAATLAVSLGGHLGGKLVFGAEFLPF
ncbi:MAG: DUF2231 domain-containing protein [Myxococcales bacterium]|nr:MAG: DUF2231 domain-containing protein [Myxococcales bacterium]